MIPDPRDLRALLMPYCLQRLPDGYYIALNRNYKPLGVIGHEWVKYEDHPARFQFNRKLPVPTIRALSWNGSENAAAIFFYNTGCVPFLNSPSHTAAYLERLTVLARLKVYEEPKPEGQGGQLRELLRTALERVQDDWWRKEYPEVARNLRAALRLLDARRRKAGEPIVVDLGASSMTPPELLRTITEIRAVAFDAWPRRWPLHDHLDVAEKSARIADAG